MKWFNDAAEAKAEKLVAPTNNWTWLVIERRWRGGEWERYSVNVTQEMWEHSVTQHKGMDCELRLLKVEHTVTAKAAYGSGKSSAQ